MKFFHVVSHTHWDREWYQSFEEFRHRLVDLIDHLLEIFRECPEYVFELDAQTVCLEDYLEIRPERREELERRIRSGNLKVGPWYVQNDFYLTCGEATVRNLLIGGELAERFGGCARCGYVPDQFGLIGQLPQIFRNFGIDNCVFGRGYRRDATKLPNEFKWSSPDGSTVLASYMSRWYNNAQRFPADPELALRLFREIEAAQEGDAVTPERLLMNGVDHLEAQEDLLPILEKLNREIAPEGEIRQSTLCAYLDAVRNYVETRNIALRREEGELRHGSSDNVLQGTLSARLPLKRENVRLESAIVLNLEPFYAQLELRSGDALYDRDYFRCLWKCLLKNHPHDSICGCSTDRVHEDNANRFARIGDLAETLRKRGAVQFWQRLDRRAMDARDYLAAVFNPLPFARSEVVPVEVFLPLLENPESIRVTDPAGNLVRFAVRLAEPRNQNNYSPINLPGQIPSLRLEIDLAAEDLPPSGVRVYRIEHDGGPLPAAPAAPPEAVLENRFVRFRVDGAGRVELFDKESGERFEDLVGFTDESDAGYSYNFHPAPGGAIRDLGAIGRVTVAPFSRGLNRGIRAVYEFDLPCGYDLAARRPLAENVANTLTVEYVLNDFSRHVAVEAAIGNRSRDHRLRAVFRPRIASAITCAAAPFGFEERDRAALSGEAGRHNGDQPDSGIVFVRDGKRQFACFNEGLFEYEHLSGGGIALTLLRATGHITRHQYDASGRWIPAGAEWTTPGGQLIGEYRFRFALRCGGASRAELARELQAFLAPAFSAFDSVDPHKLTGGRPCDQSSAVRELFFRDLPPEKRDFPLECRGLELSGDGVFSAFKKAEDGDGYILRVYNPERKPGRAELRLPFAFRIVPSRMDETPCGEAVEAAEFALELPPAAVRTLRLTRREK